MRQKLKGMQSSTNRFDTTIRTQELRKEKNNICMQFQTNKLSDDQQLHVIPLVQILKSKEQNYRKENLHYQNLT